MVLYELFQRIIWYILSNSMVFFPQGKTRRFLELRSRGEFFRGLSAAEKRIQGSRRDPERRIWVHVASAGELEQAIPPLKTITSHSESKLFVTYFSPSAEPFLKNLPEPLGTMGFPPDEPSLHKEVINRLGITDLILVRYDLWPGLVAAASELRCSIHLLAATNRLTRNSIISPISRWIKRKMYAQMDNIFAVNQEDVRYFESLGISARIHLAGDAKWARAKERAEALRTSPLPHSRVHWLLDICRKLKDTRGLVVFGSPHKEEHEVALGCTHLSNSLALVYVPHDVRPDHTHDLVRQFQSAGLRVATVSELEGLPECSRMIPWDALIVDRVGFLAELYGIADAAVVGGGFDGQVHNTLEPAAHPVATLFGQNVSRAPEAQQLLKEEAALGFATPKDMLYFLERCFRDSTQLEAIRSESHHPLALARASAKRVFSRIPNTSEVVFEAFRSKGI